MYIIEVKNENGIGEYHLVYNGKDGTYKLEYITNSDKEYKKTKTHRKYTRWV